MDRHRRGKVQFPIMRFPATVFVLLAILCPAGCMSQLKATSPRPVEATMDVFAQSSVLRHTSERACLLGFGAPPEIEADSPMLTRAYQTRLVQRSPFARIKAIPDVVSSDAEALWYARKEACALAIVPYLQYMMDGSGGLPTKLVVRIRILDAADGRVLWDLKQTAWSEPGPDVDLTWNTVVGAPAQRGHELADCLADHFAAYLAQHLEQEEKEQADVKQ